MKMRICGNRICAVVTFLCFAILGGAMGADWPQFQGLNRDSTSPEKGLAREWPEGGPKVLWTLQMGEGFGSAVIEKGKVYVLDRLESKTSVLRCLDLVSGGELWNFSYDNPGKLSHNGSRSVPALDDKHVYIVGPFGKMHCLDKKSHEVVWEKDLMKEFEGKRPNWGFTQSPSLYKNLVIVAPQASKAWVAAFDRDTGEVAWTTPPLDGGAGYVSPIFATVDGVDQFVATTSSSGGRRGQPVSGGQVAGISAADGKILWTYDNWKCQIPIPYAKPLPGGRFFITGEYGAGSAMIQVRRQSDEFKVTELFKSQGVESQIQQPVLYKDHLYVDSNGNKRRDGFICMTLEGEVLWKTKDNRDLPSFDRGGFLLADDMIYIMDKDGYLRLVEPNPKGYKELASVEVLGGKEIWAPMALSDGKLVIRDQKQMKCLDVRNP